MEPNIKNCPNCGEEVFSNSNFCSVCGFKLDVNQNCIKGREDSTIRGEQSKKTCCGSSNRVNEKRRIK